MKRRGLDFLVCPRCKGTLALHADVIDGNEIMEGALRCAPCQTHYPIRNGIPRFVGESSYADSFGFEWHRFRTAQLDSVTGSGASDTRFRQVTGWAEADLTGALVLDAGVGAGRFAEVALQWGGEVVGVDLTRAVDAAFENLGRHDKVHLIQADIFALPFRDGTFDLVYSIGVLHHTPDTEGAFRCVSVLVKRGGMLAVYLYPALGVARHFSDALRTVTTRLPMTAVYYVSALAVPLHYVYQVPLLGKIFQTVLPISPHPHWRWRWLDTFDWYSPKYQWKVLYPEVFRWFRANGFDHIELFDDPVCMRGRREGRPPQQQLG